MPRMSLFRRVLFTRAVRLEDGRASPSTPYLALQSLQKGDATIQLQTDDGDITLMLTREGGYLRASATIEGDRHSLADYFISMLKSLLR